MAFRLIVKPNLVVIGTFYPLEAPLCIEIKRPQLTRWTLYFSWIAVDQRTELIGIIDCNGD